MKLSRNFSLRELTKSATAERSGIDNNPKDLEHLVNMTHLAIHILQPCRDCLLYTSDAADEEDV